jgi:glycosyltransferase involved in cell wall biosynthesis
MPTHNRCDFLHRSISSFINQTYIDTELIVVDDGSEDETFALVNQFMKIHHNIRYLKHSHRNVCLTKNAGILAANGKYIAFLDSDDEYQPDYIEKRVTFLQQHPTVDLIQGSAIIIGNPFVKDRKDLSRQIHLNECSIGATFFGKREIFLELGGFNRQVSYSEDGHFWEMAVERFSTRRFEHEGYVYYRDTVGSICNTV